MSRQALDLSIYLVTDYALATRAGHPLADVVTQAAAAGVRTVQIREKDAAAGKFLDTVLRVADALNARDLGDATSLVINDRVDVFLAARARGARVAGVHVGQSDLPAEVVRELIGADAVLGVSAATEAELDVVDPTVIDYVGIGALHDTTTKRDAPPALGMDGFARLVKAFPVPSVAIGGISVRDIPALRASGAAGAAVVSAICSAADPGAAARELRVAWEGTS